MKREWGERGNVVLREIIGWMKYEDVFYEKARVSKGFCKGLWLDDKIIPVMWLAEIMWCGDVYGMSNGVGGEGVEYEGYKSVCGVWRGVGFEIGAKGGVEITPCTVYKRVR